MEVIDSQYRLFVSFRLNTYLEIERICTSLAPTVPVVLFHFFRISLFLSFCTFFPVCFLLPLIFLPLWLFASLFSSVSFCIFPSCSHFFLFILSLPLSPPFLLHPRFSHLLSFYHHCGNTDHWFRSSLPQSCHHSFHHQALTSSSSFSQQFFLVANSPCEEGDEGSHCSPTATSLSLWAVGSGPNLGPFCPSEG